MPLNKFSKPVAINLAGSDDSPHLCLHPEHGLGIHEDPDVFNDPEEVEEPFDVRSHGSPPPEPGQSRIKADQIPMLPQDSVQLG